MRSLISTAAFWINQQPACALAVEVKLPTPPLSLNNEGYDRAGTRTGWLAAAALLSVRLCFHCIICHRNFWLCVSGLQEELEPCGLFYFSLYNEK